MLKKLVLPIIVFASVATASMTSNITEAFAQDNRIENPNIQTAKTFFAKQPCDVLPKMMDTVKDYEEDLLFLGEGMSFAAQSGQGFMGGMMFFTNQETGTWSMLQLFGDGTACLVMNGRHFKPYSGPKMPTPTAN
jgi:hypothetical protein|tara:strand:- start:1078 stop:1482 length:405 start_codon:yes stop_codon:yes gene_type:complete